MSTATTTTAVQGKYGFYACDYKTFCELKAYHGLLLRAYRQFRAYQRWAAKKGANRYRQERQPRDLGGQPIGERIPIPKPPYPECMTRVVKGYRYAWGGPEDGTFAPIREWLEFETYNRTNLYHHVLDVYRQARRPKGTIENVVPLDLPEGWRRQLATLREHYGN